MRTWLLAILLVFQTPVIAGGGSDELPVVKLSPRETPAGTTHTGELPSWKALVFLEQAFWATASSRLEIGSCGDARELWCMESTSSVISNQENIQLSAMPGGRLLQRKRSSAGNDRRRKTWKFGMTSVTRERQEPDASGAWRLTSSRKLVYPKGNTPVTDPMLLLVLAEPAREPREFLVNTDFNFYRVTAISTGEDVIDVDAKLDGEPGPRTVELVALKAEPVEPLPDKPDFNLLGLSGDVVIGYDRATGIPVLVRGKAPRIGAAELTLKSLEIRDPGP
jgi:hypothetical protein